MDTMKLIMLVLALSVAVNVGLVVGLMAAVLGVGRGTAFLSGVSAAGTVLGLYFAAVAAY